MNDLETVVRILDGRFPGEFASRPGHHGYAPGLEVRRKGRAGYAFLYEPSRPNYLLLALHETDEDRNPEVWGTASLDECVRRMLPWAFPPVWTPPVPIDRAEEERRLARIAEGLAGRGRIPCRIAEPDPTLVAHLGDEGRQALERDLASLDVSRIKRNFPWDSSGRLALKTAALLGTYPSPADTGRVLSLAAVGPDRRRDEQEIRVRLDSLIPINQTHRWRDCPWLWQRVEPPALLGTRKPGEAEGAEAASLRLLDEGEIEEALTLHGVSLGDDLRRLLGGQRMRPPACCAHPDHTWTELLVATLRQSAPWLLAGTVAEEWGRIARYTDKKPPKRAPSWKLAIFPGQFHARKASLMLAADRDGRNPRFVMEATASNARLADTSWKRPIAVDFARYGIGPSRDAG